MSIITPNRTAYFMTTNQLLNNPHIGFTTFQRFNGDKINPIESRTWTEGHPIAYQPFSGSLVTPGHPGSSVAYFRLYWKYFEPEEGQYNFEIFDKALETAHARGQTLMLRLAPYGHEEKLDVPSWLRAKLGEYTDAFDIKSYDCPAYAKGYGDAIRAIAARYDSDERLDSVDLSICGPWGEGAGTDDLSAGTRNAVIEAYTRSFVNTPLMGFVVSPQAVLQANFDRPVGFRADCLGDLTDEPDWRHMVSVYPRRINLMPDVWKKAPVSFEVCWVMYHWLDKGWDVDYIIEQSLKWHISTFNAKSSAVPAEWDGKIDYWRKKMGYRYALRFFDYADTVALGDMMVCGGWMENGGVAPVYRPYPAVLRIKNDNMSRTVPLALDVRSCLPGDSLFNERVTIPSDLVPGTYSLQFALVSPSTGCLPSVGCLPSTGRPAIAMPISAEWDEGFAVLGNIRIL